METQKKTEKGALYYNSIYKYGYQWSAYLKLAKKIENSLSDD